MLLNAYCCLYMLFYFSWFALAVFPAVLLVACFKILPHCVALPSTLGLYREASCCCIQFGIKWIEGIPANWLLTPPHFYNLCSAGWLVSPIVLMKFYILYWQATRWTFLIPRAIILEALVFRRYFEAIFALWHFVDISYGGFFGGIVFAMNSVYQH